MFSKKKRFFMKKQNTLNNKSCRKKSKVDQSYRRIPLSHSLVNFLLDIFSKFIFCEINIVSRITKLSSFFLH